MYSEDHSDNRILSHADREFNFEMEQKLRLYLFFPSLSFQLTQQIHLLSVLQNVILNHFSCGSAFLSLSGTFPCSPMRDALMD